MSEEFVVLSYNDTKKKIKIPKNFEELEDNFIKEFNKNETFYFSFQYEDEDGDGVILNNDGYDKEIEEIKRLERIIAITRGGKKEEKSEKIIKEC